MNCFPFSSAIAVGVGANAVSSFGSARDNVALAMPRVVSLLLTCGQAGQGDVCCSEIFKTLPVGGPSGQKDYFNAVVLIKCTNRLATSEAALELLNRLQALELEFGRDRSREQRWGPRSLDLDLLFWGELRLDHPQLVLPHPRMHLRSFVMEPLLQAMQGTQPPCW